MNPVGDYILEEFNTLYLPDSEPKKLLDYPKQKPRRGEGASDRYTPATKSLSRSIFFR